MTLELDRNGVPVYAGTAEHFDEWKERALDLYHSRAGQVSLQASTALALRGGLRDIAYESARKIPHDELMTLDASTKKPVSRGVEALVEYVRAALQQETPYELRRPLSRCSTTAPFGGPARRAWLPTSSEGRESLTS